MSTPKPSPSYGSKENGYNYENNKGCYKNRLLLVHTASSFIPRIRVYPSYSLATERIASGSHPGSGLSLPDREDSFRRTSQGILRLPIPIKKY